VAGNLMGLLMVLKGLPLAYNKDLQEDKEPLFDTAETIERCLSVFCGLITTLKVKKERMLRAVRGDFSTATDLADYLARRGLPFREAHAVVGRLVRSALEQGRVLEDLTLADLKSVSPLFDSDALEVVKVESSVAARTSRGGTAPSQVQAALERAEKIVGLR
ncbi:MAG: argininosuccinate lyase, partial [Firmicutes bacterium]|nr:argininosuccinate lyase [Bacillota bacterium]